MAKLVRLRLIHATNFPLRSAVHAVISKFLDGENGEHHQPRKPWSVGRIDFDGSEISIDVGIFGGDVSFPIDIVGRVIQLGKQRTIVSALEIVQAANYADLLAAAEPRQSVRFEFATPLVFRSGQKTTPPTGGQIFGHLRALWTLFSGLDATLPAPNLVLKELIQHHFDGHTVAVGPEHGWGRQPGKGFVGNVMLWTPSNDIATLRSLTALASLAPFTGVGAGTAFGCGLIRPILIR
jgi:hypothetical protein